jgi:hypothetical protein
MTPVDEMTLPPPKDFPIIDMAGPSRIQLKLARTWTDALVVEPCVHDAITLAVTEGTPAAAFVDRVITSAFDAISTAARAPSRAAFVTSI